MSWPIVIDSEKCEHKRGTDAIPVCRLLQANCTVSTCPLALKPMSEEEAQRKLNRYVFVTDVLEHGDLSAFGQEEALRLEKETLRSQLIAALTGKEKG